MSHSDTDAYTLIEAVALHEVGVRSHGWYMTEAEHRGVLDVLNTLVAENQQLRDALVLLADNAEAYLSLERDGQRNYPDSLGLCIDQARLALIGTPSAAQTLEDPTPTERAEAS